MYSNVYLIRTNTTKTFHIINVSLHAADNRHAIMKRMIVILFNILLEDAEIFLHMVG